MRNNLSLAICLLLALAPSLGAGAQPYSGKRAFDGEHRNEVSGYLMGGSNAVTGFFIGQAAAYTRHFTDRWSITGAEQTQFFKRLYSVDVKGTYRLPLPHSDLFFNAEALYNRYDQWNTNEGVFHLGFLWELNYVDIKVGASYILYHKVGVNWLYRDFTDASYTEPIAIPVGIGINIRPRSNPWNLGLFFRNYDHFYYENWNINWGVRFYATLPHAMKLYAEFNIRPAGSTSQLATRYETSGKLGLKYAW